MSLMQPNTPERTHRFQIFGVVFDHANNQVLIDCVDPDDVTSRVTLSRRYELDARADAERVLGQVLLRQRRAEEADARLVEAERIYRAAGNDFALLTVLALRLEAAIAAGQTAGVASAFDALASERRRLPQIVSAALFDYPLALGARWLREHGGGGPEPRPFLEQAYAELLRQTGFLAPELRQRFLFQVPAHAGILEAATKLGLPMPKL